MLFSSLQRQNTKRKIDLLAPYFQGLETVLDFGCGDQLMAHQLWQKNKTLKITGIDIVDFGHRYTSVNFRKFDGKKIPFPDGSFDTTIAWHVFHHTPNPVGAFRECMRVAKQRVIFVEPIWRYRCELPGMMVMDWLFNIWKSQTISMAFAFHSQTWWEKQIIKENGRLKAVTDIELFPRFLPTGRSHLFIVDKFDYQKRVIQ